MEQKVIVDKKAAPAVNTGLIKSSNDGVKTPDKNKPKPNHKYLRDKDREIVHGIFRFYETPGGMLEFPFKKWAQDPVETYRLIDGQAYSIPLGVAKHLCNSGTIDVHEYAQDEHGKSIQRIGYKTRRYGFDSTQFLDIDELNTKSNLITVENI